MPATAGRPARRARSRSASTSSSARTACRASTSRTRSAARSPTSTTSRVPGMIHGRVVRPRGQGAYGSGTAPAVLSVDESSIKNIPGAQVVRFKNFVGVVAPTGVRGDPGGVPAQGEVGGHRRRCPASGTCSSRCATSTRPARRRRASRRASATSTPRSRPRRRSSPQTLQVPLQRARWPIGPECCVADVDTGGARIFSNTQNVLRDPRPRADGARRGAGLEGAAAEPDPRHLLRGRRRVRPGRAVRRRGAGGGGHVGARRQAGAPPVHALGRATAGATTARRCWPTSAARSTRAATSSRIEYTRLRLPVFTTQPTAADGHGRRAVYGTGTGASTRTSAGNQYNIPNRRCIGKTLPLEDNYFKTTALRAPDAPQSAFASEQMIDELAYAAKMDPVAFRLKNIATATSWTPDPSQRWKFALEGVAKAGELAAARGRVEPLERQRRHRPRRRVRHLLEHAARPASSRSR